MTLLASGIFADRMIRILILILIRNLPYRILHQTQKVKEVSWTTHPGSSSSEYLAILQEANKQSMIDIFVIYSLPLYSNTICNTSISLSKWYDIAVVLNGDWKQQDHIPSTVADNEYISCIHQSKVRGY